MYHPQTLQILQNVDDADADALTSSTSRWKKMRDKGQSLSVGSLSFTRWCSDLVTWDEEYFNGNDEDYFNSTDEVNEFLLNDIADHNVPE